MRTCRLCSAEKPLVEFYAHPTGPDGHDTKCKECAKAYQRMRARTNPAVQEYDRARAKLPHRAALRKTISKRWAEKNPDKKQATTAVNNAVRDGRLTKEPCFFCGDDNRVHAHHHDYSKPLDVTWLCPKCHHRLHAFEAKVSA